MTQQLIQRKAQKTVKKIFKTKSGSPIGNEDVQAVGEEIDKINKKTPENVIRVARNSDSVLHKFFDWDNNSAGNKYRLEQARQILRGVFLVSVINGEEIQERAYFNVTNENNERVYVPQIEAFTNPLYKKQILENMKGEVERLLSLIKLFMSL